ncbi:hypothetical protein [Hyalangium sp.]|uniref:hypothetical protein n=1 Tax=Hyalangium sp. TaxID=2028555 RepID=UPI002D4643AF|nr:hypothetical protein [Hyalangium sp.]HYH94529.1 hypothetical protein [Hyalangium sp.]
MNRSRFLAAVLVLGGLLGAAEVRSASSSHQRRLEDFQKKAQKERQVLGLAKEALFAKYPTPELALVSASGGSGEGKQLPPVPVGTETTLTVTGRFTPGSLAHVTCAGAEVLSEKVTESSLEARVRVTTTALAGPCALRVYSPVSLATAAREAFRVVGSYQWELALANGMKARMRTSTDQNHPEFTGTSEWFGKDGKSLGTRPVKLERTTEGYRVLVERTAEEAAASNKALSEGHKQASSADTQKQVHEIQMKIQQECMAQPPDKMRPCIQKYKAQLSALSQKNQAKAQEAQGKAAAATVGCEVLSLEVSGGKVTGRGSTCGAPGDVNVTGTVTAAK